jgi:hypothetical protein
VARFLWFVLSVCLICGCGAPKSKAPESLLPKPGDGPMASETATKSPVPLDEIKLLLDLDEYPGAKLVENTRLSSSQFSPDEARFELARTSADAPAKVVAFYEEKLSVKVTQSKKGQEIWGRTKRGNFVRVHVNPDGKGSKFSLSVISYAK